MPATGRREDDESYPRLAFGELLAIYKVLRALEKHVMVGQPLVFDPRMLADMDDVRSALRRIGFIEREELA